MSDASGDLKDTEWWWIDYLEDELDSALEKDLELLLEHSQEDRDSFENFRLLKQWVRESDPVRDWPLEQRLDRLRSNVMAAIEHVEIEKPKKGQPRANITDWADGVSAKP